VESFIRSYILGEKLIDPTFQNAVLGALVRARHEGTATYPSDIHIRLAYKHSTCHSPLRKLLVDFHVWIGTPQWVDDNIVEETCPEFANDLIRALTKDRPKPGVEGDWPWIKDLQSYYFSDTFEGSIQSENITKT
jgi:hypothetical protein